MQTITERSIVSDIVSDLPKTSDLFRKHKIDFCCRGKVPLKDACEKRGLDVKGVISQLEDIQQFSKQYNEMKPKSMDEELLINYIQLKHHRYLKDELPALAPYIKRVSKVHGPKQPHLIEIAKIYEELSSQLLEHTAIEDEQLFPSIKEFISQPSIEAFERLQSQFKTIEKAHEKTSELLTELREATDNFTPPASACGTYQLIYKRLADIEKDTFDHIHLENNVLFDKVKSEF
ncbi:iron-sulfur cluster repair di-iron protein [Alkalibacillus aidingensis]|uniref:iron-sulfur cluster repair di-iron protein n=1 Tax=Alkalibacillus aidingensis TaxID=2747607 RepID=UPI0016607C67|nr:iron-sulfur cluster repair di-iron protein [Alkalibacillus aidingensis]